MEKRGFQIRTLNFLGVHRMKNMRFLRSNFKSFLSLKGIIACLIRTGQHGAQHHWGVLPTVWFGFAGLQTDKTPPHPPNRSGTLTHISDTQKPADLKGPRRSVWCSCRFPAKRSKTGGAQEHRGPYLPYDWFRTLTRVCFTKKGFPFSRRPLPFSPVRHTFLREGARSRGVKPQKSCEKVTREGKLGLGQQLVPWLDNQRAAAVKPSCENSSGFMGPKVFRLCCCCCWRRRWPSSKRFAHNRERVKPSIKAVIIFVLSSARHLVVARTAALKRCMSSVSNPCTNTNNKQQKEEWQEISFVLSLFSSWQFYCTFKQLTYRVTAWF